MHRLIGLTVGLVVMATLGSAEVRAQTWWEVESARMNALAGGPTNAHDAELLERYGCYSGTQTAFCQRLAHPRRYDRARRPATAGKVQY